MKHRAKFPCIPLTEEKEKSLSLDSVHGCLRCVLSCKQWPLISLIDKHHPLNISRHSHFLLSGLLSGSYWGLHFSTHVLRINLPLQSHLLCYEKLIMQLISNFIFWVFLLLQLSWLCLFTPFFAVNYPISQIPQDFLNCSILFHFPLSLRFWSVLNKFFSFKNNFAVLLQSAWFPSPQKPTTTTTTKIPAGVFLFLLPWLHWHNDTDASEIIPVLHRYIWDQAQ